MIERVNMNELRTLLLHEIISIYGLGQGQAIGAVIIPAFINDFEKTVKKADSFDEISEEYMTEDKRVHLILYGRKRLAAKDVEAEVTGFEINDKYVEL